MQHLIVTRKAIKRTYAIKMSVSSITIEEWIYFEVLLRALQSSRNVFKGKCINHQLFINLRNNALFEILFNKNNCFWLSLFFYESQ